MSFTLVEVTGHFTTPEGLPASGTITARPTAMLRNGTSVIEDSPVLGELNSAGELKRRDGEPFYLPATDDSGTTPTTVLYRWTLSLDGVPPREFSAPLPHASSPVDLSAIMPAVL